MRCAFATLAVFAVCSCDLLEPKGETVTCTKVQFCGDDILAEDTPDVFCTDPADEDRAAQITQYQDAYAETCGGVVPTCTGGVFNDEPARCEAKCTAKGECEFEFAGVPQSVTL